jgi:hypothetical protein
VQLGTSPAIGHYIGRFRGAINAPASAEVLPALTRNETIAARERHAKET